MQDKILFLRLAGQVFEIHHLYDYLNTYCKGYTLEKGQQGTSVIPLYVSSSDIEYERDKSAQEDRKEGLPIRQFSDEYLETLAVYRKIAECLLPYGTVLFHGSVVSVDGKGYLFTAKSGTGKSTHTRLWREYFGGRAVMVNDDKPLIGIGESGVMVYGTPWDGKHRLSSNVAVPLKAICIIERGLENQIEKVEKEEVYPLILQQANRPLDKKAMMQTLKLLDQILDRVPVYSLRCNMELEAAKVAYEGMQEPDWRM